MEEMTLEGNSEAECISARSKRAIAPRQKR